MNADEILQSLRQNQNLYRIANRGNQRLWFAPTIPANLSISEQGVSVKVITFSPPAGMFHSLQESIAGWMSYDEHFGGKISSATAFIFLRPAHKAEPSVEFVARKEFMITQQLNDARLVYGLEKEYVEHFCEGIIQGLQTAFWHPVADIKVEILNAITDTINSDLKAFERLGQWLTEALIIELYKKNLIEEATQKAT